MKGKKGPENSSFKYRGVRQRTWGKWVVEICEPMGKRLWLGNFENTVDVALSYDKVAREMYGSCARTFISSATEALEQFDVVAKSKNAGVAVKQMLDAVVTE
jgi:hypothetical protein